MATFNSLSSGSLSFRINWVKAALDISLLSEGRTVVKCICECNQSGRRVAFYSEPVAMSTTSCACVFLQHKRVVIVSAALRHESHSLGAFYNSS